jgi:nucleoside-diphosphate-sugar epimerase
MKVFLTGASGVVGRRVFPLLLNAGHQVTAIARTAEKRAALERMGVRIADVDLFSRRGLARAVAGHEVVINLATHMPRSTARMLLPGAWWENDRIRREGSANLVDAALAGGVQRFVQESFAPVYPGRAAAWIEETVPLQPAAYNRTIVDAERSVARFCASGRCGVVLRFALFYGPDSRFTAEIIRLVRHGLAPMPGAPGAFVSSISHDDAASAVVAALALREGAYNVCDDEPVTHREYFDSLAAALGVERARLPPAWTTRLFGPAGEILARSQRISNRKLRDAAGFYPRYPSVREGWYSLSSERVGEHAFV